VTVPSISSDRRRIAIVTGGGAGIGAAVAEELGRQGTFVITMDPLVTVDGSEQLPSSEETTAERIVNAGGSARASAVSVTDAAAVRRLFDEVVEEFGGVDAVVNVAGISRPTSFARGSEQDWRSVLSVHLDGYRNVLDAALTVMAAAGHGHILGVTSGSGWRAVDTGAYGCAKRAVAALTWQLGRLAPPGVVVNAVSPIAMTRMVTNALKGRTPPSARGERASSTGGLSLGSMPAPEELGPLIAHLVGDQFSACRGQVLFTAGSEMAVIDQPRLIEVLGVDGTDSFVRALDRFVPGALVPGELHQQSGGGSNARFGPKPGDGGATGPPLPEVRTCIVVADTSDVADATIASLESRGVLCHRVSADESSGFDGATEVLASGIGFDAPADAVVVALAGGSSATGAGTAWEGVLAEHTDIVECIHADAAWVRAVADQAARAERPVRLVTLTDATTAGGRSRAQASAQLARSARGASDDRVAAFAISIEAEAPQTVGELAAHLICSPDSPSLSGAELVVEAGSVGLRAHPRVRTSLVFDGATVPDWLDGALRRVIDARGLG
jgi:NAD(P)-dependent dehydrogenase (short-subunit alcohol dehydrogenase family)